MVSFIECSKIHLFYVFLLFCRRNTEERGQKVSEKRKTSSDNVYNDMAETMNDLSHSYYSLKRNSIQTKNFNNNDNNGNVMSSSSKYNLKPSHIRSNEHDERSVDGYDERSVDVQRKVSPR